MSSHGFFLEWFDRHPSAAFWPAGMLIVLALWLAVKPFSRDRAVEAGGSDWRWGLLILAILAAGRWPSLVHPRSLNQDEAQLLAGAHALTQDPVFWRSVNGGTAGPLDFFALWPAGWLCGWDNFFAARLTALILLAASLVLAHLGLTLLVGTRAARVAGLGAVVFESLTHAPDFLHYSTELVPVTLLAAAAYAAIRRWRAGGGPAWSAAGGIALGAIPLAKLQAAPLAAAFGLCWLWCECRAPGPAAARHRLGLVFAAAIPAAFFIVLLALTGEWTSFVQSYVRFNLAYAGGGSAPALSLLELLRNSILNDSLLHLWLPGSAIWLALMVRMRPSGGDPALRLVTWAAFGATLIAFGSIAAPGRPFLHYWQLMVVPLIFLLGSATANLLLTPARAGGRTERWLVMAMAVSVIGFLLQHRARHPDPLLGPLAAIHRQYPHTPLATRVRAHARPGETLAIWGRSDEVYVEAGLRQATRDSQVGALLQPGPLQRYFRERYLADFSRAQPATFVDSVGAASPRDPVPAELAHDRNFPELAVLVAAGYTLVDESALARIYRRNDLAGR